LAIAEGRHSTERFYAQPHVGNAADGRVGYKAGVVSNAYRLIGDL
jgi:hypothetical protein